MTLDESIDYCEQAKQTTVDCLKMNSNNRESYAKYEKSLKSVETNYLCIANYLKELRMLKECQASTDEMSLLIVQSDLIAAWSKIKDYELLISYDAVDRQSVRDAIRKYSGVFKSKENTQEDLDNFMFRLLDEIPSVIVEQKKPVGYWISKTALGLNQCSVCHVDVPWSDDYKYCPHCGAELLHTGGEQSGS